MNDMATAPLAIYETTPAQELYETAPSQEIVARADGLYWLAEHQLRRPGFVAAWRQLARHAVEKNPYFEDWFLLPSLANFDARKDVRVVAYYQRGELAGLMPLVYSTDYYGRLIPHWKGWLHPNMFLGCPLILEGAETDFWTALLSQADANAGMAAFLHLAEVPTESAPYHALVDMLRKNRRDWGLVEKYERAVLEAGSTTDEYRAEHHSKRKRKDMRRRLNRLKEQGEVAFDWAEGVDGIYQWVEDFLRIEASGWKGEAGSALSCAPETAALFRETIAGAAAQNRVTRLALILDGKPIAMLANFLTPPFAFGFKTAFDDDYSAYSPGILLEDEYLSELDRKAFDWCDSCAAPDHSLLNAIWGQRREIGKLSIPIGGRFQRMMGRQVVRLEMGRQSEGEGS